MAAILLLHDDELIRIATRMMLQRAGHQVHDTHDTQRGIGHLKRLGADLVIAKAEMAAAPSIRETNPFVPILLVCPPEGETSMTTQAAEVSGTETVSSPFSAPDLISEVDRLLAATPS
jgi:DNA-binding NtrC family response regulator